MIKQDEIILFNLLWINSQLPREHRRYNSEIIEILGMNRKRAEYILEKWSGKGFWSYGVNPVGGWFDWGEIIPGEYFPDGECRIVPWEDEA